MFFIGFLIAGGGTDAGRQKVEIYIPASNRTCRLQDLPDKGRFYVSMCAGLLCGAGDPDTGKTCLKFNLAEGTFRKTPVNITYQIGRLCWDLGDRGVLTISSSSNSHSDLVSSDGLSSTSSFSLRRMTM